jgi:hypothetical protein
MMIGRHERGLVMQSRHPWPVVIGLLLFAAAVDAGDVERFAALDREAVREAERDLSRLFDPAEGRVLEPPSNPAERYVVARERRWFRERQRPSHPLVRDRAGGGQILELGPAGMSTTWLVIGPSGEAEFVCDASGRHFSARRVSAGIGRTREVLR